MVTLTVLHKPSFLLQNPDFLAKVLAKGTTFFLYLPAVQANISPVEEPEPATQLIGGKETILLVEDEDMIREMATQTLTRQGYKVLSAMHGQEALDMYAEGSAPIDLIITDVIMPHMSGKQMVERLAETRGKMPVLYISGYTESAIVHHGILDNDVILLQKPFTPATLTQHVRAILDAD